MIPLLHYLFGPIVLLTLLGSLFAGAVERNYLDPTSPVYVESKNSYEKKHCLKNLQVVSYNLHFAKKIKQIIAQFQTDPELSGADVILLQEVVGEIGSQNKHSAHELAAALGFNYAYAPAFVHPKNERDFGVAIVSRYPISEVTKIILPHVHFQARTQRIALGATINSPCTSPFRVYSAHLETLQFTQWRIDQAQEIVKDTKNYPALPILIGGDFNTAPFWQRWFLVRNLKKGGLAHLTDKLGATMKSGPIRMKLDLFFSKKFKLLSVKKAKNTYSDHSPIVLSLTSDNLP